MNRSMVTGIVVGASIAVAGAVMANYVMRDDAAGDVGQVAAFDDTPTPSDDVAAVTSPAPAAESVAAAAPEAAPSAPQEECWDEEVTHTKPAVDDKHIAGTVIGAIVGGAIGSQFGGGSGKTLATVAGAAAGGYGGNRAQNAIQDKSNTYTTIERRCRPVE
jgi:uncharacterized protein YcfJ